VATLEQCVAESRTRGAWVLLRLGHLYSELGRDSLAIDRLTHGLSAYPQDSAYAAQSAGLLDSLIELRGGDARRTRARVASQRAASERAYWLGAHRDGHRAPDAAFVDLASDRRVSLRGSAGLTVVYAWATWCGPCRASMPKLQAWAGKSRTKPVRVLTVNAEGEPLPQARAKASKFFSERGLTLPVLLADTVAAARWGLGSFPMTLVLRDGEIVFRGHAGDLVEGLEAQLASLGSRPLEHPARNPAGR